ncbi:MAG: hypothetical protein ACNA8W_25615, partial [Bradymonadaceae bacterium]
MKRSQWAVSTAALLFVGSGILGCQISEHATQAYEQAPVEEATQAEPEGEPAINIRPGQTVSFHDGTIPNPARLGPYSDSVDWLLRRNYTVDRRNCDGFVSKRPTAVFDAPNGIQHLRISADGNAQVLFVELPGRDHRCAVIPSATGALTLEGRNWPPGQYRIHVGGPTRLEPVNYHLTLEDMTQAVTVDWLSGTPPTLQVDGSMATPRFVRQSFDADVAPDRKAEHGDSSCHGNADFVYPLMPDIKLDVTQAAKVQFGARSDVDGRLNLLGPVPEDQRNIPTRCLAGLNEELELAPGNYYLRFGVAPDAEPHFLDVFAHAPGARLDPITRGDGEVPAGLPVNARQLDKFYPFMTTESLVTSDALRHEVFTTAPPQLFVAAGSDLSATSPASLYLGQRPEQSSLRDPSVETEFPRQNEPLLLVNKE